MTDRRVYVEALINVVTSVAICVGSVYAVQYFLRNPEQEKAKAVARQKLELLWLSLGRSGPPPEFNEFELAILKDVLLPHEISTNLDDIGGLDSIKSTLWETVLLPFVEPNVFHGDDNFDEAGGHNLLSAPLGVLFYGPPGTGKTMMAKAIAKSTNAVFIPMDFSTMYNKYLGESEKLAKALFTLAKKLAPTIIFIDEVDVFLRKRGNSNEHEAVSMMKGQFMTLWDGLTSDSRSQVMVMGATNRPYDLDDAILRRLPRQILFGLPQTSEREAILRVLLAKSTIESEEGLLYGWVARRTADYSGSDLKELCKCAAMQPMRDFARTYRPSHSAWGSAPSTKSHISMANGKPRPRPITMDDFKVALTQVKPTGREALDHLQRFYTSQLMKNPFMSGNSDAGQEKKLNNSNMVDSFFDKLAKTGKTKLKTTGLGKKSAAKGNSGEKKSMPGKVVDKTTQESHTSSSASGFPVVDFSCLENEDVTEDTIDSLISQLKAIKTKIRDDGGAKTKEQGDAADSEEIEMDFEDAFSSSDF